MRKLRVLVMMHRDLVPPPSIAGMSDSAQSRIKTEIDVTAALAELGHEFRELGLHDELRPLREAVDEFEPDVVFNLLEEFHYRFEYEPHLASYLELLRVPYTGCNPRGLTLAHDKAIPKLIAAHQGIRVPRFEVFPMGRPVRRPARLAFPLIVKSLTAEGSAGIAKASLVHDDWALADRAHFVHKTLATDAIAEEFIEGRELYVSILGNERLSVLPPRELTMKRRPGEPLIATETAKHSFVYQEKYGIESAKARLPRALLARVKAHSRRIYRALGLDGYARIDWRLREDGELFFLEANPNPEIAAFEEFAEAARTAGIPYNRLIQRVLRLGLARFERENG
jgi:D-alanine-D-alanine ligase